MKKVPDQKIGPKPGGMVYETPEQLKELTSQQRMRVLSARAEQAKKKADEKLLAFAAKNHPQLFSTLNFFPV